MTKRKKLNKDKNDFMYDPDELLEENTFNENIFGSDEDDDSIENDPNQIKSYFSWKMDLNESKKTQKEIIKLTDSELKLINEEVNLEKMNSLFIIKIRRNNKIVNEFNKSSPELLSVLEYLIQTIFNLNQLNFDFMIEQFTKKEVFKNCNSTKNLMDSDTEFFEIQIELEYLKNVIMLEKRNYSIKYEEFIDNDMHINLDDIEPSLVLIWVFSNIIHEDCYVPILFFYNVNLII